MKYDFFFLLTTLFITATAPAAINYDRIPADATGYFMADFKLILASQLLKQAPGSAEMMKQGAAALAGDNSADMLVYTTKLNGNPGMVIEGHSSSKQLRQLVMDGIKAGKSDIVVLYRKQEIHYSCGSRLLDFIIPNQAIIKKASLHKEADSEKMPTKLSIGLGLGDDSNSVSYQGDSYIAFLGDDLIIASVDLASMAQAIDVIEGNKPSLASQDPQGIRTNVPPGAMVVGAGLTASFIKNADEVPGKPSRADTTQPANSGHLSGDGFGLDLFGSLKAKAHLARFDVGENQNQVYADGVFTMEDTESAGQLKNLVTGVKALVSLTQPDAQPLIGPLQITTADKNVLLHWTWSTDKLPALYRLAQPHHDSAKPTSAPATRPTH